ncbi:ankyrin repeat domain-containing protein [Leptolyngbya sp. NIES-2104]|uniref:ankyrin repeat domain-containing protein n=1 Tax=Leptolyngbya sp. NIES-2104 TaxID=1552121 RepID=UPI0006EC701A|nr:ankyrin repeat domain-containing protein [Leptolyngbya sp. NIES-2104]GAP94183.1 hypothetical protein NIES2104_06940 [Leptolyngbya sp. NIES-2104]
MKSLNSATPNPIQVVRQPWQHLTLWALSTLGWLILFPIFWFLTLQSLAIWMLGQSVWMGHLALWLLLGRSSLVTWSTFAILTTAPPALSYSACRKVGVKGLLPIAILSALLIPVGLKIGRIDTQGTILAPLEIAAKGGDLPKARGLMLTLTRRYHRYEFFTNGGDLIRLGIDPNVQGDMGNTPLMTVLDEPTYVQQLIELGANVNIKNQAGETAIDLATNPQTIQLLKQAGARSGRSE